MKIKISLCCLLILSISISAKAQDARMKSVFIYNFVKYIEWPNQQQKNIFFIGVLTDSQINSELENLLKNRKIGSQSVVVTVFQSVDEIFNCQVIFIPADQSSKLDSVLKRIGTNPTLVITEEFGLTKFGAGISFLNKQDNTLTFEINKNNITKRGLKINSTLLNLGEEVF